MQSHEGRGLLTSLDPSRPVTPAQPAADHVERTPAERLAALLGTLRRRWRVALLVVAVTVATTLFLTMWGPPQYAASAQILLQPSDAVSQVLSPGVVPSPANAQRDIDTNTGLITSTPVLEAVRNRLGLSVSNRELKSKIDVSGQETSNLVSITARDESARQAARIATAVTVEYDNYRREAARDAIRQSVAAGTSRMLELERTAGSAAERHALRDRLIQLRTSAAIGIDAPQVIRRASTPRAPTSPSRLIPVVSVLLGMTLAVGAAVAFDLIDKRLLRSEDVESAFGVPVLLSLWGSHRPGREPKSAADDLDPYASLAARIAFSGSGDPARVIMISSTGPRDVSWKVATGLSSQLSALGLRVVYIEATIRRIPAGSNGEVEPPYGLSAVLQGIASFSDELLQVYDHGETRAWKMLPSGAPVPNPGSVLGWSELRSAVSHARADADFVLVEGPTAELSEAFPVAALSEGIVLVAEVPGTTRDHATGVRQALGPLYSKVLGLVVCATAPRRIRPRLARAWQRAGWRSRGSAPLRKLLASAAFRDRGPRRDEGRSRAPTAPPVQ
jgi:capsular polysaccharide biosynthesis protein